MALAFCNVVWRWPAMAPGPIGALAAGDVVALTLPLAPGLPLSSAFLAPGLSTPINGVGSGASLFLLVASLADVGAPPGAGGTPRLLELARAIDGAASPGAPALALRAAGGWTPASAALAVDASICWVEHAAVARSENVGAPPPAIAASLFASPSSMSSAFGAALAAALVVFCVAARRRAHKAASRRVVASCNSAAAPRSPPVSPRAARHATAPLYISNPLRHSDVSQPDCGEDYSEDPECSPTPVSPRYKTDAARAGDIIRM